MLQAFGDCCGEQFARSGYWGLARLWCATIWDVACSATSQHLIQRRVMKLAGRSYPSFVTPRAQKSLTLARVKAIHAGRDELSPRDVLLGLVEEGGGVAALVLRRLSADLDAAARAELSGNTYLSAEVPFDDALIQIAQGESRQLGHDFVGTEHLLLGLISRYPEETDEFLARAGVTPEQIRRGIAEIFNPRSAP